MIYCRIQDVEMKHNAVAQVAKKPLTNEEKSRMLAFLASRFFNADGDDVTEILAGDIIGIIAPGGNTRIAVVLEIEDGGWLIPRFPFSSELVSGKIKKGIAP